MNTSEQKITPLKEFEVHIFISYAHLDNRSITNAGKGWISRFSYVLDCRLAKLWGIKPRIWLDESELHGADDFANEIVSRLPKAALLVSVLSPSYIKSEWCKKELKEFCRVAEQTGGLKVANKYRILKVIKTPVSREEEPEELKKQLGFKFFEKNDNGKTIIEFDPELGSEAEQKFFTRVFDLSYEIKLLLDPPVSMGRVYLAETSSDLQDQRDVIKRLLEQSHYTVLPEEHLSYRTHLRS